MPVLPLVMKAAIPVVLTVTGVGAAVVATASTPEAGAATVWIDGPADEMVLAAGDVPVVAHASSTATINELQLVVDNQVVATDTGLERNANLVFAGFSWSASNGTHTLVVRVPGGASSQVRILHIGAPGDPGTAPSTVGDEVAAPATDTTVGDTVPGETTTTSSTVPPEGDDPGPGPGPNPGPDPGPGPTQPTTKPTVTTAPAAKPVITLATVSGTGSPPVIYTGRDCGYVVTVKAQATNATSVQFSVDGTGYSSAISGGTATLHSGFASSGSGDRNVTITATGPGGTVIRSAGTINLHDASANCPKD